MTTTALLLASLDVIHLELSKMQHAIDDDAQVTGDTRRAVKRSIHAMRGEADRLSAWLGEARLETSTH